MTNEKDLTPWFPAGVKPARVGVYLTQFFHDQDFHDQEGFSHWNGVMWGQTMSTPKAALKNELRNPATQHKRWRGLAHPPKGA